VEWEYEVLLQRFDDLKKERDELKKHFMTSVYDVKQKCGFKSLLLEKKLSSVQRVHEEKEAQLNEVLARANLQPSALGNGRNSDGVEDVMHMKNEEARKLQSEVARLQALQQQLRQAVFQKMEEYGLAPSELGYNPQVFGGRVQAS
jgi:growth arrest-specific protein 8